jgi:repressor LexA
MPYSTQTNKLTPRQSQLLKAIASFQSNQFYSPTIGELAGRLKISRSTTFEHIAELRKKGLLSATPARARSLKLTSKAQRLLRQIAQSNTDTGCSAPPAITLVGRVAAGSPIEAVKDAQELSLRSNFGDSDDLFALQVTGDSMIDDGIEDGDYVICRPARTANTGQLVIALLDNENATLKRFYKEKDRVRLQPANENYCPIYSDNCRIQAVVLGLIRKF